MNEGSFYFDDRKDVIADNYQNVFFFALCQTMSHEHFIETLTSVSFDRKIAFLGKCHDFFFHSVVARW